MFQPSAWNDKVFDFSDKRFITDHTVSFMHIPLNMGRVMKRLNDAAEQADAISTDFVLLSEDVSPWHADHYLAVDNEVPGAKNVTLNGRFYAKVYEGQYSDVQKWHKDLAKTVSEEGYELKKVYFYYTTCPKCAKEYGKNYVVGFAKISG